MPGGMEPKISLKMGPTCEWGEQPPEGTPVPNNTHSEQVGEMPRDSRRATGPKETPTLNTTSWMERASTYLPCTRNLAVGSARARQSSPVGRRRITNSDALPTPWESRICVCTCMCVCFM